MPRSRTLPVWVGVVVIVGVLVIGGILSSALMRTRTAMDSDCPAEAQTLYLAETRYKLNYHHYARTIDELYGAGEVDVPGNTKGLRYSISGDGQDWRLDLTHTGRTLHCEKWLARTGPHGY